MDPENTTKLKSNSENRIEISFNPVVWLVVLCLILISAGSVLYILSNIYNSEPTNCEATLNNCIGIARRAANTTLVSLQLLERCQESSDQAIYNQGSIDGAIAIANTIMQQGFIVLDFGNNQTLRLVRG